LIPIFSLLVISQAGLMVSEWFLAFWTNYNFGFFSFSFSFSFSFFVSLSLFLIATLQWYHPIIIYSCLVVFITISVIIRSILFFVVSLRSSQQMFNKMLTAILRSPLYFFSTNPQGRILNRLSKDQVLFKYLLHFFFSFFHLLK